MGLIITSGRDEFIAGADLKMLQNISSPKECMNLTRRLHQSLRELELWPRPVVAAMTGTALGAGYEICLGANWRVCINHSRAQIGLPEVTLGLLAGGGGTQRLPRMMGVQNALPFLTLGKKVNPEQALKKGLIDELAKDKNVGLSLIE